MSETSDPDQTAKDQALIAAVITWAENKEGSPDNPNDAELLKALWTYEGDKTEPCDECDGECGEPCAPCTVEAAHRMLDRFSEKWRRRQALGKLDWRGNPVSGDRLINCCYPDCGCDGARLCMAENGANYASASLNLGRRSRP